MPFKSEKQRRYLWANEPKIARDWADTYGSRIEKNDGGIMRVGLRKGSGPGPGGQGARGQETQNPGVGGRNAPPGRGSGPHRGMHYTAPTKTHTPTHTGGDGHGNIHGGPTVKEALKKAEQTNVIKRLAEDKREERVEKFRHKNINNPLSKAMGYVPYIGTLKKMFPQGNRGFFLDEVLNKGHYSDTLTEEDFYGLSPVQQEEKLKEYNRARGMGEIDAYGRTIGPQRGDGQGRGYRGYPNYAAWAAAQGQGDVTEVAEVIEEDVPSNFQPVSMAQLPFPNYPFQAANGGRIPAAFGGIMDSSTGRRAYGLGSIFKSIGRAAKKVFKSPIGKAALIGMAGFGIPGTQFGGLFGKNPFSTGAFSKTGPLASLFRKRGEDWTKNKPTWGDPSWAKMGIAGASALPFFMGGQEEDEDSKFDYDAAKQLYADEIMRIKAGAMAGTLDPNKFSYLGVKDGGRIGLYAGGQSTPSDYTMEDAMMTTTQDKLGGITDVMKQADLYRQGSVGQFYAANGGSPNNDRLMERVKELEDEGLDYNSAMAQAMKELSKGKAQGGRIGADEGGLMDLGGMEKDYRNDGGFVPLGGEEKADDVPARLSKNEFVFTADAVRGAGDGDIDKGAEIMENIMTNLEQGGQISKETQGLGGAQEMFDVSERLSEVV